MDVGLYEDRPTAETIGMTWLRRFHWASVNIKWSNYSCRDRNTKRDRTISKLSRWSELKIMRTIKLPWRESGDSKTDTSKPHDTTEILHLVSRSHRDHLDASFKVFVSYHSVCSAQYQSRWNFPMPLRTSGDGPTELGCGHGSRSPTRCTLILIIFSLYVYFI